MNFDLLIFKFTLQRETEQKSFLLQTRIGHKQLYAVTATLLTYLSTLKNIIVQFIDYYLWD